MAKGDTKTQNYLDIAANGKKSDFPASCCETRSQTLIREVGERIMDLEDEVEELENNPDVADIVATYADLLAYDTTHLTDKDIIRVLQDETHNNDSTYYRYSKTDGTFTYIGTSKQYSNFVGTDGVTAGSNGLVPAPATTDAGKFLKADGTWAAAGGGGDIKELTSADYNYPTESPDGIALWKLPNGFYKIGNTAYVKIYIGKAYSGAAMESVSIISDFLNITGEGTVDSYIYARRFKGSYTLGGYTLEGISSIRVNKASQVYDHSFSLGTTLEAKDVVDTGQLASTITTADSFLPLSAGAGKTLAQRLVVGLTAAPDNGTIGVVGTIATSIESGTPHLYMCTAASGSTKTWVQLI